MTGSQGSIPPLNVIRNKPILFSLDKLLQSTQFCLVCSILVISLVSLNVFKTSVYDFHTDHLQGYDYGSFEQQMPLFERARSSHNGPHMESELELKLASAGIAFRGKLSRIGYVWQTSRNSLIILHLQPFRLE